VMLRLARLLNRVTLPKMVVVGMGILLPPHFVTRAVASCNQVEITVRINIEQNSSGLYVEWTWVDDMLRPSLRGVLHPDSGIAVATVGYHEIRASILVDISNYAAGC